MTTEEKPTLPLVSRSEERELERRLYDSQIFEPPPSLEQTMAYDPEAEADEVEARDAAEREKADAEDEGKGE